MKKLELTINHDLRSNQYKALYINLLLFPTAYNGIRLSLGHVCFGI